MRRDRLIAVIAMAILALLSWLYLVAGAGTGMDTLAMTTWQFPPPRYPSTGSHWLMSYWFIMLAMWWVMMIAMMLPSAAPMILLYVRVYRHNRPNQTHSALPAASFLAGYLLAWLLFSLVATGLHWSLEQAGLVHGMMMWSSNALLSALFLMVAGLYQFTALKNVCLTQCRAPVSWLTSHWRAGNAGAMRMGIAHGCYCVGCCWSLMLLLFVGGVMNLVWIAALAILVLAEKLLPKGDLVGRLSGVVMVGAGVYLLASS